MVLDYNGQQVEHLARYCRAVCKRYGYNPTGEPEYESAINAAIHLTLMQWQVNCGRKVTIYAARLALRKCKLAKLLLARWRKQDQAAASRGKGPATPTPISITDHELLRFVVAHGRLKAAKLLAMSPSKLRDRLDEIAYRVNKGLSD